MTLRKLLTSAALAIVLSMGVSIDALATTSTINITPTSYVSVAGPGTVAATVTATRDIQYIFSATQPATIVLGHKLSAGQSVPLASMGSGIYMWVISEVGSGVAVVTLGTDATISNGTASGGGGGGGDASAANQTSVQANAGSDASKAISIQGITSGKAIPVSASSLPLPTGASTNAGITGSGSKTLTDINTTLGTPLQAGGSITVTSAPTTAVTNSGLSNIDVSLSTRLKPADTLSAVTTVGTITNPVAVTGTFWQTTQPVSGTFWQATQPVSGTVTATAGTNLNTSLLALDTSVNGVIVSQASTTSGQKGPIIQGAVTTSSPTYTTGQSNPLSLDTSGNLRVNVVAGGGGGVSQGSTTSGQIGSLTQGAVTTSAPSYTTAQTSPLSLDTSGNLRVVTSGGLAQGSTTSGQNGSLLQAAATTSAPSYTSGTTNPISQDTAGNIRINCVTGCGGGTGGTAQTDQAAFTASTTSFTPIGGVFSNGLSAVTTGQNSTARITSDRAILVSQIPPTAASAVVTNVDSTAYENAHLISGAPATLLGCFGYSSKASAQFIQIFNAASVPSDTAVPTISPINVPATSSWSIDFGIYGRPFSTGIAISNSSTGPTKTIGSADSWFSCRIK